MLLRPHDATQPELRSSSCRENDVGKVEFGDLLEHSARLIAKAGSLAHLAKTLPEDVGKEADHDVGLHPVFSLMPDRTELQILFVKTERRLGFRQLDIGSPEVFRRLVGDIGPQEIASLA
ncbi:MAG: hypothetical protein HY914_17990 [Desulfomonile tiedjei]|nr:hypothetical protein [Desulfomonile tiedjei]